MPAYPTPADASTDGRIAAQAEVDVHSNANDSEDDLKANQENQQSRTLANFPSLFNLSAEGQVCIWSFQTRSWIEWSPAAGEDAARRTLWQATLVILKVIYFSTHLCTPELIRPYIPDTYTFQVYDHDDWRKKVRLQQSLFDGYFLKSHLAGVILARWMNHEDYPVRVEEVKEGEEDEEAKMKRMAFFNQQARSDQQAQDKFISSASEAVDWSTIRQQKTDMDRKVYEWNIYCLASAANFMFELNLDIARPGMSKEAVARNREWVALAAEDDKRPHYREVPLTEIFFSQDVFNNETFNKESKKRRYKSFEAVPNLTNSSSLLPTPDPSGKRRRSGSPMRDSTNENLLRTPTPPPASLQNNQKPAPNPQTPIPTKRHQSSTPKSHNLTTANITSWTPAYLENFLGRMRMSLPDITTFLTYPFPKTGKLTGSTILKLTKEDIINDKDIQFQTEKGRITAYKIVKQLRRRAKENDRFLEEGNKGVLMSEKMRLELRKIAKERRSVS